MKNKKEVKWFSHDHDAINDPRIILMMSKHGYAGYGRWWRVVEIMRNSDDYQMYIGDGNGYIVLARELRCKPETVQDFIKNCIDFGLLILEDGYIYSEDLRERMVKMDKRKAQSSFYGKKGAAMLREKKEAALKVNDSNPVGNDEVEDTQYNTQHNNTLHNNTMMLEEQPTETTKNDNDMYKVKQLKPYLDTLADHSITDQLYFAHPVCTAHGIGMDKLRDWLQAFNRHLTFLGDTQKSERDYRSHFVHWLKFQDVKGDATAYKPLPDAVTKATPAAPSPAKSYDDILAARQREADGI
jgi:hypothetical protein